MIEMRDRTTITVLRIIGTTFRVARHRVPRNGAGVRPVDANCHLLRPDGGIAAARSVNSSSNIPIIISSRGMAGIKTTEMAMASTDTDRLFPADQILRTVKLSLHSAR
jgi:hypothetical protein